MRLVVGAACAAVVCAVACNGGTDPPTFSLVLSGRAERGLTVNVSVRNSAVAELEPISNLVVTPADAVTLASGGDLVLLREGPLTISGETEDGAPLTMNVTVTVPPTIVFDARAAGNRDVYRVVLDGSDLTRLTTSAADDVHPTATGSTVLFTTARDGNSELYLVGLDGTNERRLTTTAKQETQASLAPDGHRVAYTYDVSGSPRVWIASIDLAAGALSGAAPLSGPAFGTGATIEGTPSWSPASDRLTLMATATPSGGAGVFTANATAGVVPSLVAGSGTSTEVEPSWSPDGFRVAFAATIGNATEIFVRDLRTAAVTQLTMNTGSSGEPAWLIDGRVVFTTFAATNSTLRWVDPDAPGVLHTIPLPGLAAEHAAPVRQ